MSFFASIDSNALGHIAVAAVLGALGVYFLLPRPRGRSVTVGIFLSIAAAAVAFAHVITTYGKPTNDTVGQVLFWFFSGSSILFGGVLVAQRNPARGAIAFAFVILSSCGLFLLLAAPFLMAATIIIYAGAIIVTFLFVLMLSHANGPSDENDRTREPLLGSLAGFAFSALVLIAVYLSSPASNQYGPLPLASLNEDDQQSLRSAAQNLQQAIHAQTADQLRLAHQARKSIIDVVGPAPGELPGENKRKPIQDRLRVADTDPRSWAIIDTADRLRARKKEIFDNLDNNLLGANPDLNRAKEELRSLRGEVLNLAGHTELPSRNVTAIGQALYSEHLLAVEMAGALLLVATIGAVAIAQRKGATP